MMPALRQTRVGRRVGMARVARLPVAGLALGVPSVVLLSGCGSGTVAAVTNGPGAAAGTGHGVTIVKYSFQPAALTVKAGTTVRWTNQDPFDHSVVEDDGTFKSDAIHSGSSFSHTYDKAGTYAYHCGIHNYMTATIVVS